MLDLQYFTQESGILTYHGSMRYEITDKGNHYEITTQHMNADIFLAPGPTYVTATLSNAIAIIEEEETT